MNNNVMAESVSLNAFQPAADAAVAQVGRVYVPRARRGADRVFFVKRSIDFLGALIGLVLLLPVFAVIAVMIKRAGGPVFFRHGRVGKGGETFHCYKFCSMVPNGDEILKALLARDPEALAQWTKDRKLKNDPRVTPLGRFLRRTSLDELPQLINVLRGEMSLVGPRPIVRDEMVYYGRAATRYMSVRPGITGLWQVTGRNDVDYEHRVALDSYYVRNMSPALDAYILLKTVRVVFSCRGAY